MRPETLGQAGRIPGVTPAAVAVLDVYLTCRAFATEMFQELLAAEFAPYGSLSESQLDQLEVHYTAADCSGISV